MTFVILLLFAIGVLFVVAGFQQTTPTAIIKQWTNR
jgi:hypothetical protein